MNAGSYYKMISPNITYPFSRELSRSGGSAGEKVGIKPLLERVLHTVTRRDRNQIHL